MSDIRLGSVSLDCDDPAKLAEFWASMLGGEIAFSSDNFVAVQLPGLWITAVKVERYAPPSWPSDDVPKQIHLDLSVKDLEATRATAIALGATLYAEQPSPGSYLVFADPAGHPFCLTTQIPD